MGFFKRLDLARRNAIDAGADDDELEALMREPSMILKEDIADDSEFPRHRGESHARGVPSDN